MSDSGPGKHTELGDSNSTPYDDFDDLAEVSDAYGQEPQQVGETEGGLQIMAFDEVDEEGAEEFAEFALGSDEEDVDQMFDDVFKGGGDDSGGGGLFGGGGDGGDMFDDAGGGDMFDDAGGDDMFGSGDEAPAEADAGPESAEAEAESGGADEISTAIDDELGAEEEEEEAGIDSLDGDSFSSEISDAIDENPPDHPPPPEQAPNSEVEETPATDVMSDPPSSPETFDPGSEGLGAESSAAGSGLSNFKPNNDSDDLDRALDSLEEESEEEKSLSLSIGGSSNDGGSEERPADDSLEALVQDAQNDIKKRNKKADEKDALDEVLGDDMPPAPDDDFEFDAPNKSSPSFNTSDDSDEDEESDDDDENFVSSMLND